MMEKKTYRVADHIFAVYGDSLCKEVSRIEGFRPFEEHSAAEEFCFLYSSTLPDSFTPQYSFEYEDVHGEFGSTTDGFYLKLKPVEEEPLHLWYTCGNTDVFLQGNLSLRLFRFALWIGYGLMTFDKRTIAIHSSCIVCNGRAVLFLGESGTGKSTHTRLWRENISGAVLLNDDSPIVRVLEDGSVWVYGSPWSGKTPCYKPEKWHLCSCVRLSQAPYNKMHRLSVLKAYAALHPSCPPEFAYDERIYSHISSTLGAVLQSVPCWHLECLPDAAAALLSYNTVMPLQ